MYPSKTFDLVRSKAWKNEPEVKTGPTMLTQEELQMLRWLARDVYQGEGLLMDCGCFLGGSTAALAQGLREGAAQGGKMHSFDLFVAGEFEGRMYAKEGLAEGKSFRALYEQHIAAYRNLTEVHEGDITQAQFPDGPIELLFIDCAKVPQVNDFFVSKLFPRLVPGLSIIIQQDYLHDYLPWIKIAMEYFSDYFELLGHTTYSSVIYGCVKPIPSKVAIGGMWDLMGKNIKHLLMQQAINRWEGENRQLLIGSYASFNIDLDKGGGFRFPDETQQQRLTAAHLLIAQQQRKIALLSNKLSSKQATAAGPDEPSIAA